MSYGQGPIKYTLPVAESALQTADTLFAWVVYRPMTIWHVGFLVTTLIGNATVEAVLSVSLTASGASIAEKDTITVTKNSAVGTELAGADTTMPFDVRYGETITFKIKTAATVDTAGAGYWLLFYTPEGKLA